MPPFGLRIELKTNVLSRYYGPHNSFWIKSYGSFIAHCVNFSSPLVGFFGYTNAPESHGNKFFEPVVWPSNSS